MNVFTGPIATGSPNPQSCSMKIVCAGNLVADIFVDPIIAVPAAGQLALTERLLFGAGGCATNTAACLRRLGSPVKVLGKVGDDVLGNLVIEDLKRLGIDASCVSRSRMHPTSGTVIINVTGEDRRYIHCIGANADFSFSDIDFLALNGAKALYVGGYMAMPRFGAEDLNELFREAKKRSLTTILDVVIPLGQSISREQVAAMLVYTDVFLPNNDEAYALTGLREPRAQADYLARMNPDCCVVITQGRRGALAQRKDEVIQVGTYAVEAIDESGSGDAFAAGFITAVLQGWSLEDTLRFASAVGASCTRALGCTDGVFRFDEALTFMSENSLPAERWPAKS
jgi:sugar/nucleoside kinase (ribokinase family)